jgi:uncharacterized membrane protein
MTRRKSSKAMKSQYKCKNSKQTQKKLSEATLMATEAMLASACTDTKRDPTTEELQPGEVVKEIVAELERE